MVTFHVVGKLDLTILVGDIGVVKLTKNVLCVMFMFQWKSMHVFKDVAYIEDNVVWSFGC